MAISSVFSTGTSSSGQVCHRNAGGVSWVTSILRRGKSPDQSDPDHSAQPLQESMHPVPRRPAKPAAPFSFAFTSAMQDWFCDVIGSSYSVNAHGANVNYGEIICYYAHVAPKYAQLSAIVHGRTQKSIRLSFEKDGCFRLYAGVYSTSFALGIEALAPGRPTAMAAALAARESAWAGVPLDSTVCRK